MGRDARDSCTQDSCELSSADKGRLREKQPAGDAGSGEMFFAHFCLFYLVCQSIAEANLVNRTGLCEERE